MLPDSQVFTFDRVFTSFSTQVILKWLTSNLKLIKDEIYNSIGRETIEDVLNGYNGTIFTYGQTSSGKTYTMYGDMYIEQLQGIVPRTRYVIFLSMIY